MNLYEKRKIFKDKVLYTKEMTVLCGAFDGITAKLVERVGFDGCYMGGQAAAASMLGVPDIGLTTEYEQVNHARALAACINIPFIMDADTGYGNRINIRRTISDIEDAGIYGAHFEDQVTPKRCGAMNGVEVESLETAVKKIETAVKYRKDENFLIIGRTDSASIYGIDEAIRRANAMAEVGADMVFYGHVIKSLDELKKVCDESKAPVMFCLMEHSYDVCFSLDDCKKCGVKMVIWPNGLLMRWFKAAEELMIKFKYSGDPKTFYDELMPIEECNKILGLDKWI